MWSSSTSTCASFYRVNLSRRTSRVGRRGEMTAKEAPGPRTEGTLHLGRPPQGPTRLAVRSCMSEARCAKGPSTERRRVAPGPLLVGVARNTVKTQVAKGPPTACRRVAPGLLLVGVARKHVKIRGCWAAENLLFAPNRMQIGADLRHRVFEGVAKMRRRGL